MEDQPRLAHGRRRAAQNSTSHADTHRALVPFCHVGLAPVPRMLWRCGTPRGTTAPENMDPLQAGLSLALAVAGGSLLACEAFAPALSRGICAPVASKATLSARPLRQGPLSPRPIVPRLQPLQEIAVALCRQVNTSTLWPKELAEGCCCRPNLPPHNSRLI